MKNFIFLLAFTFTIASCRSTKPVPAGAPEKIRKKDLIEKLTAGENQFQTLSIRANGSYNDKNNALDFRLQIRVLKDSLIWIDIADPIIGIKVARAVVYKDSVAFINRIQQEYYTGKLSVLQKKINLDLGFATLQNILAANLAFDPEEDYELSYQPGYYLLADHPLKENGDSAPVFGNPRLHKIRIDPVYIKPVEQSMEEPAAGKKYTLLYNDIRPRQNLLYPGKLEVKFMEEHPAAIELTIKDIEKDQPLSYPFTIPEDYAKMR